VDRYFDKNLADLIWNQPNSPDEVGPLDGDPLYTGHGNQELRHSQIKGEKWNGSGPGNFHQFC